MKTYDIPSKPLKANRKWCCGYCGRQVKQTRLYQTEFISQKIEDAEAWLVWLAYVCPRDNIRTQIVYQTTEDPSDAQGIGGLYARPKEIK